LRNGCTHQSAGYTYQCDVQNSWSHSEPPSTTTVVPAAMAPKLSDAWVRRRSGLVHALLSSRSPRNRCG
jgi:hypothetical protein